MTKANIQYSAKAEVSNLYIRRSFYEKAIINLKKAPVTAWIGMIIVCLLYTSPSPRDVEESRMPSSA